MNRNYNKNWNCYAVRGDESCDEDMEDFDTGDDWTREQILVAVDIGKQQGAKLLNGWARMGDRGYFIKPTVFGDVSDDMKICKEEILGPVQAIQKVKNMDDAIARANK